ncbi:MAG: hypothetical protein AMJ45_05670 [Syntrophobacter sp. DG_60]|nr:MAG: hypothetical protein AMJ45_05670 [Syntrophobacter sp. DG_60]
MISTKDYNPWKYLWCLKIVILISILVIFLPSCSTTRYITETKRSAIEQLLLTKSVERAIGDVFWVEIKGSKIYIETASLATEEENYLKKAVSLWCLEKGAVVVEDKNKADYIASVLVKSLGTDRIDTVYLGIPSLPVPLTGISTPEIDILGSRRQKGYTELEIILYSASTGQFVQKTKPLIGKTHFSTYKIFLIPIRRNNIF